MAQSITVTKRSRSLAGPVALVLLLVAAVLVFVNMTAITDWVRAFGYTPSEQMSALVADDTMTAKAVHLVHINRAAITSKNDFGTQCSSNAEQTIVLGCYHGVEKGIFVLKISGDKRLDGVMQVTAAHEMLHAAYDRLSKKDKDQVNAWLLDYYNNSLTDQRIKKTIESYKQTEPTELVNEMHSIFGTEIKKLPDNLENYYKQYFTDRQKIAGFAADYQAEFTKRQAKVDSYDDQLDRLKKTIKQHEKTLDRQTKELKQQSSEMNRLRTSGQVSAYNQHVSSYNAKVNSYNDLVATTKNEISQYNDIVEKRNSIALEQQQLANELSGNDVSTIPSQ